MENHLAMCPKAIRQCPLYGLGCQHEAKVLLVIRVYLCIGAVDCVKVEMSFAYFTSFVVADVSARLKGEWGRENGEEADLVAFVIDSNNV